MVSNTPFRQYCWNKWYEHKDEIYSWTGKALIEYDVDYYFSKHKWLLKAMYKNDQENQTSTKSKT